MTPMQKVGVILVVIGIVKLIVWVVMNWRARK